ncbi:MAG: solute:sodium symporter family transporter [Flavobacteriales bacterium AspAUS03]
MDTTVASFIGFTFFVAIVSWLKIKHDKIKTNTNEGYFLGGRTLTGVIIAGSMLLTNLSTEQLIGLNGAGFAHGMVVIAWESTAALALIIGALFFLPKYLSMRLITIPQYLETRFDKITRTITALLVIASYMLTLPPIVLYTGAINMESIFNISENLGVTQETGIWYTIVGIGLIGSLYAILGGLRAIAFSDTLNGIGLIIGGLAIPVLGFMYCGEGGFFQGVKTVYTAIPDKFNAVGDENSAMPFSVLFTGLIINQLYYWCMNQSIVQRALGAKNLAEGQKGLLVAGFFKTIIIPIIIIIPGIIVFYINLKEGGLEQADFAYSWLLKKVLSPTWKGLFAAVIFGAILSTFNSVLNSAATLSSLGIYKGVINKNATEKQTVQVGVIVSVALTITSILIAPLFANASQGLFYTLQELNGIFFIPIGTIILVSMLYDKVPAIGAKSVLIFGTSFYILTKFVLDIPLHFIHIWGIEFVLNIGIMLACARWWPRIAPVTPKYEDYPAEFVRPWRYAKIVSLMLAVVVILGYIVCSDIGKRFFLG